MGEDPPERPGGLEGPFSPGHALSLPVWGLRGENQVDAEVQEKAVGAGRGDLDIRGTRGPRHPQHPEHAKASLGGDTNLHSRPH